MRGFEKDIFRSLGKDPLNHLVGFLSPSEAVALQRSCKFTSEKVDLKLANWTPYLKEIIKPPSPETPETPEKSKELSMLAKGFFETFENSKKQGEHLEARLHNLGVQLQNYDKQSKSKGKYGANLSFWLSNLARSVYSGSNHYFPLIAAWISLTYLGGREYKPGSIPFYLHNINYYTLPILVAGYTLKKSYSYYQGLFQNNKVEASSKIPEIRSALEKIANTPKCN